MKICHVTIHYDLLTGGQQVYINEYNTLSQAVSKIEQSVRDCLQHGSIPHWGTTHPVRKKLNIIK